MNMAQVFTSYSRRDTEIVDTIVGKMTQAGISVWIDREAIKAGNQWRVQIVQAIDTCQAFVLMLSPNSAASDNVRKEIDLLFIPLKLITTVHAAVNNFTIFRVELSSISKIVYRAK